MGKTWSVGSCNRGEGQRLLFFGGVLIEASVHVSKELHSSSFDRFYSDRHQASMIDFSNIRRNPRRSDTTLKTPNR